LFKEENDSLKIFFPRLPFALMSNSTLPDSLQSILDQALQAQGKVVFLTGAGISAESGIPTFRGKEGYWTVGSKEYHPKDLATHASLVKMPDHVWGWYLYRRGICRAADPNEAHLALASLEESFGDRFQLITQNVDGLHLRAGNSLERTFQIHGNIDYYRCEGEVPCCLREIPKEIQVDWPKERSLDAATKALLTCPKDGHLARPHVLLFDEYYDEETFKFESSIAAAIESSLLVVVGTSGQTNLPMKVGGIVTKRGSQMVVVNQDPSPFTEMADSNPHGFFAQGTATQWVPAIVRYLQDHANLRECACPQT
jgi:NAD-dependent deacetylase